MIVLQVLDVIHYVFALWMAVVLTWIMMKLFLIIRPMIPVVVRCWFCNAVHCMIYKNSNSWHCTQCLQYNGFTEDGDYNKVIHEQYKYVNRSFALPKSIIKLPKGLCEQCNASQEMKIKKLASFKPANPAMFDTEVKQFQLRLERVHSLCCTCERFLSRIINQNTANAFRFEYCSNMKKFQDTPLKAVPKITETGVIFCHIMCSMLSLCLIMAIWFTKHNGHFEILTEYFVIILSAKEYIIYAVFIILLYPMVCGSWSVTLFGSLMMWATVYFLPWLILETDLPASLEGWTLNDIELVLLTVATIMNSIAVTTGQQRTTSINNIAVATGYCRGVPKIIQLVKIPASPDKSPNSGKLYVYRSEGNNNNKPKETSGRLYARPSERNFHKYEDIGIKHQNEDRLFMPELDSDIAKLQLGSRQYSSPGKHPGEEPNGIFHRQTMIRPSKLHVPVFETTPRTGMSSFVSGYRQVQHNSFHVFSAQSSMFPSET